LSKTLAFGFTDTAFTGGDAEVDMAFQQNFGEDFRVLSDVPGELILTNITTPVDMPETIRIAQKRLANVYSASDIDASNYPSDKSGTTTLVESRFVVAIEDSTEPLLRKFIPVKVGFTLITPNDGDVPNSAIRTLIERSIGNLFETHDASDGYLNSIRHGVLSKKDM